MFFDSIKKHLPTPTRVLSPNRKTRINYLDNVKLAVNWLVAQLSKLAVCGPGVRNQDRILGYMLIQYCQVTLRPLSFPR